MQLTDTCDEDRPHLVVHVETTPAPVSDVAMTAPVYEALRAKDLLPEVHFVDAGYVDADLLVDAKAEHGIELVGPVRPDTSWQAKAGGGLRHLGVPDRLGGPGRHMPAGVNQRWVSTLISAIVR